MTIGRSRRILALGGSKPTRAHKLRASRDASTGHAPGWVVARKLVGTVAAAGVDESGTEKEEP